MSETTNNQEAEQNSGINPFDIFGVKPEDITSFEEQGGKDYTKIYFEPAPTKEKPYVAMIKFLMNIEDPTNPAVFKIQYKIPDPEKANSTIYYDSPRSINQPCIVAQEFSRLWNEGEAGNAIAKAKSKEYKRSRYRCSVIQIIKDPQNPELNGQLRLFRYQFEGDIDKKIQSMINPSKEEIDMGAVKQNIYNPFSSPVMLVKATEGDRGRDFAESKWSDTDPAGMVIPEFSTREDKRITLADSENKEIQKKIVEMLQAENISIKEHFAYKPSDEQRLKRIADAIAKISGGKADLSTVAAATTEAAPAADAAAVTTTTESAPATTESKPAENAAAPAAETATESKPAENTTPAAETPAATESKPAETPAAAAPAADSNDALFAELGIPGK